MRRHTLRLLSAIHILSLLASSAVSWDGQNRRQVRRRSNPKKVKVQRIEESSQIVKDDCASSGNIEGCSISNDASEPKTYPCEFGLKDVICVGCSGGRFISAPTLCYPPVAKAARASGIVRLKVVIGETGKVIWARVTQGNPLLRLAALRVACQLRYEPFVCSGRAVKGFQYISVTFRLS